MVIRRWLVICVIQSSLISLFAPFQKCPYRLRDTLIVRESGSYCTRYKDNLRKFFRAIYEAVGNESGLVAGASQSTRSISKIKDCHFLRQYEYFFTRMHDDITRFSLMLYLLEMFTIVNREGGVTKDFFTLCDEFSRKDYFDGEEQINSTFDIIKRLSPNSDNVTSKDYFDDEERYYDTSDEESFDEESLDDTDDGEDLLLNDTLDFVRRLRPDGDNVSKDELQEKIKRELATTEISIIEAFSSIAAKIQEKETLLESSKMPGNSKLNIKLLDYILNKLLTFADKSYFLVILRVEWVQAGLFAFIGGENLDESKSFKASVRALEKAREKACDDCLEGLDRVIYLFRGDSDSCLDDGASPKPDKLPRGANATTCELFDACGIKLPLEHYSNFAGGIVRIDENFGFDIAKT